MPAGAAMAFGGGYVVGKGLRPRSFAAATRPGGVG